ncbi:MAG: antibiotic biosynthesis monooxygenase [Crocinitomicaceae bacterium]|nr:antibiotic biosynthesis monooxygenase [Crocinitomicaceae bacterium]
MGKREVIRIVRLTFSSATITEFEKLYEEHEEGISSQPGCIEVKLVEDASNPYVRATISKWVDEASLNNYRKSELFGIVWPKTKALFGNKPEVWTYVNEE